MFGVVHMMNRRKDFFRTNQNDICFIVLLSFFFILDLQLTLTIFYRMIFFTYFPVILVIQRLFQIYRVSKNDMIVPLFARLFLVVYLLFFLYKFCIGAWTSYGLNSYRLFYFY